jgi:hypothetical protein
VSSCEHAPPGIVLATDRQTRGVTRKADRQPMAAVRLVHLGRVARAPPLRCMPLDLARRVLPGVRVRASAEPPQTDVEPMGAATGPTNHAKPLPLYRKRNCGSNAL